MELQEKILDTIKTYKLIDPKDIVIVAVSGGPDSMCLLDNLLSIKEKLEIKEIVVAHDNHQIREEAQSETEYVEEYCKHKKIRCFTKYVNIPQVALEQRIGTEEAGRNERYKFFDEVAQKIDADKIAIAHNLNDNAETVLMHLMRGSGISGLCGIKASVEGRIIRPLIKCERTEIEQYCKEKNLDPKFDKSNNDNTYTRNKIRNELIPYIQNNINPNIIQTLSRLSELVIEEEKFMEKTITLKVKYDDFTKITRSFSLEHPIYKAADIRTSVYNLVKNLEKNKGKIRLLGVTVSNLSETEEEFKNITISEYLDNIKETTK